MRYGPRFSQHGVSAKYDYDEVLDRQAHADNALIAGIMTNLPLYKRELIRHKAGTSTRKRYAGNQSIKDERLEAERRMLEAMRKVVSILEFHLEELHRTRKVGNEKGLVNQYAIHNALVLLRTKCGVHFDPNEYDHHVDLCPRAGLTPQQREDERETLRYEQRAAREARLRRIADRLIARPKS
jgi:hypothetical protein